MSDYAAQRLNMVEGQVRANDVTDRRIQIAMADIPRERFVPEHLNSVAYADICLEVASGRHMLDPRCFSKLLHLASIRNGDHVLDVGCASGYSAAILGRLAGDVIALEENQDLARIAGKQLLDMDNVRVEHGALSAGFRQGAPYDVIFVNGALESSPDSLLGQLAQGGRLVAVIRYGGRGRAHLYVNNNGAISDRAAFDAQVPVLPGFEKVEGFVF
ncbi:MAG: protein-L-isoaspartate O-methyltransferase [Micropepsaceae bacterium]